MIGAGGLDFEALKKQAQSRDFRPVELPGVTFSADYGVRHDVIVSRNVAAKLTGTARPDEVVIHTAHFDHLGIGLPDATGDAIYNGAVDNGTGTAALLELARVYASRPRTERSVVFLAVTAEEKGLLGSEYYAANPLYPLEKTVAVLNTDALKPDGPARDFTVSGKVETDLLDRLVAVGTARGRRFAPDPRPQAGHFFRSDHFPFAKRGVPAVSFGSGEDWVDGGVAAGKGAEDKYVTDNYHQPSDEWSAQWPVTGMVSDMQLLYGLGRDLAESRDWPNWAKDSEFREVRDKSAAARK
jgi:Zn-dependent M28 family amino/carboxypeptidase